jgi:hypothetical protein
MKRISSEFTPFLKYILPWTVIIVLVGGVIASFVRGQIGMAIGAMVVGTVKVGL